jgi:signal transduction histidine kinase
VADASFHSRPLGDPHERLRLRGSVLCRRRPRVGKEQSEIAAFAAQAANVEVPRPPKPVLLWAIALGGFAAAACAVSLALTSDHLGEPGVHAALQVWALLGYVLAGVLAWWHRPDSRFGPLLIAAGAVWFLTSLSSSNFAVPFTIGIAFDLLPAVLFVHVFLAFPSGRLRRWYERGLVAVGYLTAFGVQLVGMALGGFGPDNLLELTSKADTAVSLLRVQLVVLSAVSLAAIVVLAIRRRGAGQPLRRSIALLVDAFVLALVMVAVLLLSAVFGTVSGAIDFETLRRVTFFIVGLAPLAFLVGLLNARLARSAVGDLLVELRAEPAPADLRDALARALRDPSLTLLYWLPDYGTYADLDGRPFELPEQGGRRATTLIERDGARIAALVHDAALEDERELLDAATAAAGIALENGRLHAELRARLEELKGSRARIVDAGQSERQRLERNLHDGAQQRLIALSLELSMLEERLEGDADARTRLEQARQEIATSLEELRDVARGIHPAVVSGHGLEIALEQLAARAPVPVRLRVALEGRLPERLEVAAFYLVSESLANVGKHAQATSATVEVARTNGQVVIEVVDDGIGGADTELGSGLRGLADRVEALEGWLRIWSPKGGGTRLRAEIPCVS